MSLTCAELTDLNRRQKRQPVHFERDKEGEVIHAAGLLEIGVTQKPRNVVIAWVSHVLV